MSVLQDGVSAPPSGQLWDSLAAKDKVWSEPGCPQHLNGCCGRALRCKRSRRMTLMAPTSGSVYTSLNEGYATHEVTNQPGTLAGYNAFTADRPLIEAVKAFGADWAWPKLEHAGAAVGSEEVQQLARLANRHPPELRTHDRFGHRIDQIEFHPAYHELMELIFAERDPFPGLDGGGTARCPGRPRRAELPLEPGRERRLLPDGHDLRRDRSTGQRHGHPRPAGGRRSVSPTYDPRPIYAGDKRGATVGMAMTEKQGGSDLRATITTARPATARSRPGRGVPSDRPQMVLLGADERSVPHSRSDREGPVLLPRHRLAAGRLAQPPQAAAAQGQMRQQVQCLVRGRIPRPARDDAGRGRARHPHDHRRWPTSRGWISRSAQRA